MSAVSKLESELKSETQHADVGAHRVLWADGDDGDDLMMALGPQDRQLGGGRRGARRGSGLALPHQR